MVVPNLNYEKLVGVLRLERRTPCSQSRCAKPTAPHPESPKGAANVKLISVFAKFPYYF